MAEVYKREVVINYSVTQAFHEIKKRIDWPLHFENLGRNHADLVYLTGMFSGARILALSSHGARKALVFVKLIETTGGTRLIVITGGSETWLGLDFGRHKRNVDKIFEIFGK